MTTRFNWSTAIATGSGHLANGTECQDALGVRHFKSASGQAWIVAVTADGAGSAARSQEGSERAAKCVLDFIVARANALDGGMLSATLLSAFRFARAKLTALASETGEPLRSFATTLNVFVSNGTVSAFAQVGDGIMLAKTGTTWVAALQPFNGEYANETVFLTCDDWGDYYGVSIISEPVSTVLVTTDGFRDLAWKKSTQEPMPILEVISSGLRAAPEPGHHDELSAALQQMIEAPHVRERSDDDVSLVAIAIL